MNPIIEEIYATGNVQLADGSAAKECTGISKIEGEALHRLICKNLAVHRTLEVGCANGLSSLYICEALRTRGRHTVIDPFQERDWHNVGIANLKRAGFDNFEHVSELSEIALPRMVTEGARYDLIFLDGWHTFDQALVESFYALRLLPIGGYLVLHDADMPAIWKLVSYLKNYECLKLSEAVFPYPAKSWARNVLRPFIRKPRMLVFQKVAEDDGRDWNWYKPF